MYRTIYPEKDSVIYSQFPTKNTSLDQILDLGKSAIGEPSIIGDETVSYEATYNSRILIQFDLNQLGSNTGSNPQFFLTLKAADAIALPTSYTVYAFPVSGSWSNGRGYVNSNPISSDGVSWKYRHSKLDGRLWETSSLGSTVTASYSAIPHGGTWFTSSVASQSFNYDLADIRMDVTPIVRQWLSGSIQNNGFVLKFSDSDEFSTKTFGLIQLYSMDLSLIHI